MLSVSCNPGRERDLAVQEAWSEDLGQGFFIPWQLLARRVGGAWQRVPEREAVVIQEVQAHLADLLEEIRACLDEGYEPSDFAAVTVARIQQRLGLHATAAS